MNADNFQRNFQGYRFILPAVFAVLFSAGCDNQPAPQNIVRLATTTSVRDSGLLDALTGAFRKDGRYFLQPIVVGSGQAMQLGRTGEADILWVHSPDDERRFVDEGWGTERVTFMHNDFVIAGPAADPAGIKGAKGAVAAFRKIAEAKAPFVSRADNSGTHKKELKLWAAAGAAPAAQAYLETGQGMAATLSIANEKNAYTLADRSTYLAMRKNIGLAVLCEGGEVLINRYSIILANPAKFPRVNAAGGRAFFDFLLSKPAREIIEKFGRNEHGRQVFFYDHKNPKIARLPDVQQLQSY